MAILVQFVAADGRILTEDRPAARTGTTWATPIDPCAASLHIRFEPEQSSPCGAPANFHSHVLSWLKKEQRIPSVAEVLSVTGQGADWSGAGNFFGSFVITVRWRDNIGKEYQQDFDGDDAVSLLYWMVSASQPPEEP